MRISGRALHLLPCVTLLAGCAPAVCGDGLVGPGESCDDGNDAAGDGCSASCLLEREGALADRVLDAPGATGHGFGDPTRAIDGVRGGGAAMQSLDVYSLGIGPEQHLVLGWSGRRVIDGPGIDLVVFENPFEYGEGRTFVDAAIVEVSADGASWVAVPHDYLAPDERLYSADASHWIGFAGVHPVFLHAEERPIDPADPAAGGDRLDLAALPEPLREGVCCVRIVAAASRTNPDTGAAFPIDAASNGPDVDGVYARWLVEPP